MATSIVSNSTAANFKNSPQKTGEPLDHAKLYSGKGLEFDGVADYFSLSNFASELNGDGDFTFALWINFGAFSGKLISGPAGFEINVASTYLRVYSSIGNSHQQDFTHAMVLGNWHRIVYTQEGTTAKLYVDGVLTDTETQSSQIGSGTAYGGFISKRHSANTTGYIDGKMSDLQMWNEVWELSDVQYDYENPESLITNNASVTSGITTSNLMRWYPMNDTGVTNPQTVVFDAAGTNNTTKNHATTTFLGDELFDATAADGSDESYWTSGGGGGVTVDSGAIKITNDSNTYIRFRDSGALSEDLEVGATYRLTADIKVNTGSSVSWYISGPNVFLIDGLTATDFTTTTVDFVASHATNNYLKTSAMDAGEEAFIDNLSLKKIGIASGWTEANQQQTIPQTALMNGSVKSFVGNGLYSNSIPSLSYPFTLSCWVYKTDDVAYGVYLADKDASNIYFGIALGADDKVYLQASNTSNKNTNSNSTYTNQWVHVVASFESATDRNLYINGSPNTDNENNDSVTYENIDRISVGYMGDSSPTYSGSEIIVDEICVFSTGLNDSEASELYNNGLPLNATNHSLGDTNLVGYWRNNDLHTDGKWKDQISTNHLTANDTPSTIFFQEGITANLDTQGFNTTIDHTGSKGALHLNGSHIAGSSQADYVDLGYNVDIDGDFTVEMWRKMTKVWNNNADGYILGADNVDFLVIPYNQSSGKLHQVYIRTNSGDTNTITLDSSTDGVDLRPSIYEWFHIAFLRESGTYKVYINGVDLNTGDRETGNSANNFTFKEIAKMVGTGNQGQGFVDELKIYDKALTVAEAKKNYNHGKSKHKNS